MAALPPTLAAAAESCFLLLPWFGLSVDGGGPVLRSGAPAADFLGCLAFVLPPFFGGRSGDCCPPRRLPRPSSAEAEAPRAVAVARPVILRSSSSTLDVQYAPVPLVSRRATGFAAGGRFCFLSSLAFLACLPSHPSRFLHRAGSGSCHSFGILPCRSATQASQSHCTQ
ncbi:hypothetical protein CDD83_9575 [Cordyceps sp. RAO-2017]|nr:hypothetical protein CDD83_9575 [Cordyceps sp. RAO-2017]